MRHDYAITATSVVCDARTAIIPEVIVGFTLEELRGKVAQRSRRQISRKTIERWVAAVGLVRNQYGIYEESDIDVLHRLAQEMRPGRKLAEVAKQIRTEFLGA